MVSQSQPGVIYEFLVMRAPQDGQGNARQRGVEKKRGQARMSLSGGDSRRTDHCGCKCDEVANRFKFATGPVEVCDRWQRAGENAKRADLLVQVVWKKRDLTS